MPAQPGPRRPSAGHRKPRGRQRARPGSARAGRAGSEPQAPRPIPRASRPKPRAPGPLRSSPGVSPDPPHPVFSPSKCSGTRSRRRARRVFVLELPASRTARQLYLPGSGEWAVELANKKPKWPREVKPGDPQLGQILTKPLQTAPNNHFKDAKPKLQLTLVNCAQ